MKLRPRYPLQFLVALVAACVLWYVFAAKRSEEISVRGVRAQLTLVNIPRDLVLTSTVPDTVSVQVRGPLSRALDTRNPPEVLLDLSDARPGLHSYPINESDISLPAGVEVVSVDPPAITLEMERRVTRLVTVRPVVEGTPAPGFVIASVQATPPQITVQGPESRLADLAVVETSPVSVEGATEPVQSNVQPQLPDPLVRTLMIAPIQVTVDVVPAPAPTPTPRSRHHRG